MHRVILLVALLLGSAATAQTGEGDQAAMRGVIERQLEAFRSDDAGAAYAFAAPGIQRLFPDEQLFMRMVREGYRPVHRPRSHSFGAFVDTPEGPAQAVVLQDEDGVDWLALYSFERQPDGNWKISGCTLVRQPGQAV